MEKRFITIYSKRRGRPAVAVLTVEVDATFAAAVAACDAYRAGQVGGQSKVFWNWTDSAWNRLK